MDVPPLWINPLDSHTSGADRVARPLHIVQVVVALASTALGACSGTFPGPSPEPAPAPPVFDARDRQLDILTEAVGVLREELGRSYENSQQLAQETERLRRLAASLQRELGKRRGENKALRDRVRALEKELSEIGTPAPQAQPLGGDTTEPSAEARSPEANRSIESRRRFAVPSIAPAPTPSDHDAATAQPEPGTAGGGQPQPAEHEGDEAGPPGAESE